MDPQQHPRCLGNRERQEEDKGSKTPYPNPGPTTPGPHEIP